MSEPALFDVAAEPQPAELAPVPDAAPTTTADVHALLVKRYSATAPGNGPRYVLAPEVRNRAGFSATRAADLMVMDTWESGPVRLIGHEIKVSRSDWLRELKDPTKAGAFIPLVAEWWLVAADRKIVKDGELPEGWGLLAPAGNALRAVVSAARKPQPPIAAGLLATLLRSVQGAGRAEVARVRNQPFTLADCPSARVFDGYTPAYRRTEPSEIQPPRYDLRRSARR